LYQNGFSWYRYGMLLILILASLHFKNRLAFEKMRLVYFLLRTADFHSLIGTFLFSYRLCFFLISAHFYSQFGIFEKSYGSFYLNIFSF